MPSIGVALTGVGALSQASSARTAANSQRDAANQQIAIQRDVWNAMQPFVSQGTTANRALAYESGIGSKPRGYAGYTKSPSYQFQLDQGQGAINALAGAQGGLVSGKTLQDLGKFNQGLASQDYGNFISRLQGLSGTGVNALGGQSGVASNIGEAYGNIGNARAAGAIGTSNALNTGINNYLGLQAYQKNLAGQGTGSNFFLGGK